MAAGFLAFVPVYVDRVGLPSSVPLAIYASLVVVLRLLGARLPDRLGAVRLCSAALVSAAVGLRPACFFENTTLPSTITSSCPKPPNRILGVMPSAVARCAIKRSSNRAIA